MKRLLLALMLPASCSALPRDTEGTLDRVHAASVMRVGMVADPQADRGAMTALAARIAAAAGARPVATTGAAEPLLATMEQGRLDLVIGAFAADTSWRDKVTLAPPVGHYRVGTRTLEIKAAVRNGENRWAMLVEQASRATAPPGGVGS